MRRTQLFGETLRQSPNDSEVAGHSLLLRGGFVQPLSAGIFSLLPLGQRVRAKLEKILREEMDAIDGQEVSLPVVHPAELWQETGRWYDVGPELARFRDRAGRDMVLAMTHEEVVADLLRKQVRSYRQLPIMLYQIQTKFRDEPRARGGLLRVREFVMKDAYSCHANFDDLDAYYPCVCQAYLNIFGRAGLDVMTVEADVGMMGGTMAHEFMFVSEVGEDQLVLCDACGYAANRQIATFQKEVSDEEEVLPLEEVPTPEAKTIAALAALLDIPERSTAKAAFFMSGDQLIFAVVRGDMEVNETKLANAVGAAELRGARADELETRGIVAGYASPIGISGATVIVDDAVASSRNLVAGANREGYHLRHTNFGRDYNADRVIDIAAAQEGAGCIECGAPLRLVRGVEVGNTFKLGMKYSKALEATFLDDTGRAQYIVMGSYGIGVGRLMACIAERYHDRDGLIWPPSVAPFQIYLVGLDGEDDTVRAATEELYAMLQGAGFETLYDDRHERAGVKFKDADLLGMPVRLTVSRRTEESGQIELKQRASGETRKVARHEVLGEIRAELAQLNHAN